MAGPRTRQKHQIKCVTRSELVSTRLKRLNLSVEHPSLIGRSAVGKYSGLVIKDLLDVVLNRAITKLFSHGREGNTDALLLY